MVFFQLHQLFEKRAVILGCEKYFFPKWLFHDRKHSTPSLPGIDSLAHELLQGDCSWSFRPSTAIQNRKEGWTGGLSPVILPSHVHEMPGFAWLLGLACPWETAVLRLWLWCSPHLLTGCHPSCRTCLGPAPSQCLRCWAPEEVLQPQQPAEGAVHGLCLSHCQARFYLDVTGVCKRE